MVGDQNVAVEIPGTLAKWVMTCRVSSIFAGSWGEIRFKGRVIFWIWKLIHSFTAWIQVHNTHEWLFQPRDNEPGWQVCWINASVSPSCPQHIWFLADQSGHLSPPSLSMAHNSLVKESSLVSESGSADELKPELLLRFPTEPSFNSMLVLLLCVTCIPPESSVQVLMPGPLWIWPYLEIGSL